MNLQENIQRIKEVMNLHENTQPMKIYVDMGGVLFPPGSDDQGYIEKPKDVKGFQSWVINTKKDNQTLGRFGADGKWGRNTSNAWARYGEEYKKSFPNSTTQSPTKPNFIGSSLWSGIKSYTPSILSSTGGGENKKINKRKQLQPLFGYEIPENDPRVVFVNDKSEKKNYSGPNKILIDDSAENITQWEAAGGIGILHINNQTTLAELGKYLNR